MRLIDNNNIGTVCQHGLRISVALASVGWLDASASPLYALAAALCVLIGIHTLEMHATTREMRRSDARWMPIVERAIEVAEERGRLLRELQRPRPVPMEGPPGPQAEVD